MVGHPCFFALFPMSAFVPYLCYTQIHHQTNNIRPQANCVCTPHKSLCILMCTKNVCVRVCVCAPHKFMCMLMCTKNVCARVCVHLINSCAS